MSVRPYMMNQAGGEVIGDAKKIEYDEDYDNALVDFRAFPFASRYSYNTSIYSHEYVQVNPQSNSNTLSTLNFQVMPDNSNAMWDLKNSFFELKFSADTPHNGWKEYASWLLFQSCRVLVNGVEVNDSSNTQNAHISAFIQACLTRRREIVPQNQDSGHLVMWDDGDYTSTLVASPPYLDPSIDYTDISLYGAFQHNWLLVNGSMTLKYQPQCGFWQQSGFLPANVSLEIDLTKFSTHWSMAGLNPDVNTMFLPTLESIVLKMRRVTLTNKALADQQALLGDPRTGGYLQYKFPTQRITPHTIPIGSQSINLQIMSTTIPEVLVLYFVDTLANKVGPGTAVGKFDTTPFFSVDHSPLVSLASLYVTFAGKRYPISGAIYRDQPLAPNNYFNAGGTLDQEWIEYQDMVGRYTSENQPWLSKAVLGGGSLNIYFINMVDAFQAVDRKNPVSLQGNIQIIANLNMPTTVDTTCYVSEFSSSSLAINPLTRRVIKNYS